MPPPAFGIRVEAVGVGATVNTAGYFAASGASSNHAIIVPPGSGNVGIGTVTPGRELEVNGDIQTDSIFLDDGTNGQAELMTGFTAGNYYAVYAP